MDVDLIVLGGGPVGLAAAVAGADRGLSVLVLEQRDFHGGHGSSGGTERQWRLQYAEPDLTALTLAARSAWYQLEARVRRRLVHPTGSLWFGDTAETSSEGQIDAAVAVMDELRVGYEPVDAAALRTRFGFYDLPGDYVGVYQPDGGVIDVAAARWSLVELADRLGCALHAREPALELSLDGAGATVRTAAGHYRAEHVVVAAGGWAPGLLAQVGVRIGTCVYELTKAYFRVRPGQDYPTWFAFGRPGPADSNLFYGFGRAPWTGPDDLVQVAPLFEQDPLSTPDAATGVPRPHELRRVRDWVAAHLPGLDPEPLHPSTCPAVLPLDRDRQFYLGRAVGIPHGERLVVSTAGWGFKFVPVFGQACVDLALTGRTGYGLDRFGLPDATAAARQS